MHNHLLSSLCFGSWKLCSSRSLSSPISFLFNLLSFSINTTNNDLFPNSLVFVSFCFLESASRPRSIENTVSLLSQVHLLNSRRRHMIGSTAPTCTYNECRGCRYKCRAEQVPVEGNDPINSAYHYRCVCHR
ncbi:Stomagen [Arabidopsis thaliana x Arabidopsis arenosa]|uniref:Stomagen n=1 Tax=Arabidopsis thaliana x Arabidopsis arenosa TaxID=1240361 RepID=A0A8T1Y7X8_9BRAS|nr:Stomagen [Arabidopsis thaliana x Arabidopsis arenosa]